MGPLYPRLIERQEGLINIAIPNLPGVASYTVSALSSFSVTIGDYTALFTVPVGGTYQSPTITRNRSWHVEESRAGLTTCQFNLDDFASATVPGDGGICYLMITATDNSGSTVTEQVTAVIPPPLFFTTSRRNLIIAGSVSGPSPASAPSSLSSSPVGTPVLVLPRFADDMLIWSTNVASGSDELCVSFGPGTQEQVLPNAGVATPANMWTFPDLGTNLIYLRGDDGAGTAAVCAFKLQVSVVMGLQA